MSPRDKLAQAARDLVPLYQGDLDGLCGLYAVINGVRLYLYPGIKLTRPQCIILFDAGLRALQRSRRLRAVLSHGVHDVTWRAMSTAVMTQAEQLTGRILELRSPLERSRPQADIAQTVKRHIRLGEPVLLRLDGRLNHWTVVARFSRTRLMLFDSSGLRWVEVRLVGWQNELARHAVRPSGLLVIRPPK